MTRPAMSTRSRRSVLLSGAALALAVAAPRAAHACTVIEPRCGTIVISRSGSDLIVKVQDASGAAAVGAEVSAREGRGAFDVQKTGTLGQTTHALGISAGSSVDVVVVIGGCRISKADCVV